MNSKKSVLVLGGTSNYAFAMGTFLVNLKEKSPAMVDEIVIFHDGKMSHKDKVVMNTLFPTNFIEYKFPIKDTSTFDRKILKYFSKMIFCKFECLNLLNEYKTVIWSDYDVILVKDISEISQPCEAGAKMILLDGAASGSFFEPIAEYNMDGLGMSAGLFVFHDNMQRYKDMHFFCYEKMQYYAKNLYAPEQAIFNIMLQEFSLLPEKLPLTTYAPHPNENSIRPDAKIFHAYGHPKFWNGLENAQWNSNYATWLKSGGSKIPLRTQLRKTIHNILNFFNGR